jgi:hypothetical protein
VGKLHDVVLLAFQKLQFKLIILFSVSIRLLFELWNTAIINKELWCRHSLNSFHLIIQYNTETGLAQSV